MSLLANIDPINRMVTIGGTGSAKAESFRDILLQVVSDPRFEPGYRILMDVRDVEFTPTTTEIRFFVEFHMSHEALRRSRVAIVVTNLVDFGMANMFATLCELHDAPARGFRSLNAALEWLG
ncbi:MAG: hypothetical protein C0467_25495 [Planctomycetaceae bacterium]|nr:hypothetical protein [Planctomycetaceae bacterium]